MGDPRLDGGEAFGGRRRFGFAHRAPIEAGMRRRQALPPVLLMTDERMGEGLWDAIERLPRGAGIVFRHYSLRASERRALFARVRRMARRRRLVLILAGSPEQASAWRADGAHGPSPHRRSSRPLLRSIACHSRPDLIAARRGGADLQLVSPVFATRSHPQARALGRSRLGLLIAGEPKGVVALGGMNKPRARSLCPLGIIRWAAIDAWQNDPGKNQKRKAVPI